MDEPVPNYSNSGNQSGLPPSAVQKYVTARATLYLFAPAKSAIEVKLCEKAWLQAWSGRRSLTGIAMTLRSVTIRKAA